MRTLSHALLIVFVAVSLAAPIEITAQTDPVPYKLGMFRQGDRTFTGLVLNDTVVADLSRAGINMPLKELIARWDANIAGQVAKIAADTARSSSAALPVGQLKT